MPHQHPEQISVSEFNEFLALPEEQRRALILEEIARRQGKQSSVSPAGFPTTSHSRGSHNPYAVDHTAFPSLQDLLNPGGSGINVAQKIEELDRDAKRATEEAAKRETKRKRLVRNGTIGGTILAVVAAGAAIISHIAPLDIDLRLTEGKSDKTATATEIPVGDMSVSAVIKMYPVYLDTNKKQQLPLDLYSSGKNIPFSIVDARVLKLNLLDTHQEGLITKKEGDVVVVDRSKLAYETEGYADTANIPSCDPSGSAPEGVSTCLSLFEPGTEVKADAARGISVDEAKRVSMLITRRTDGTYSREFVEAAYEKAMAQNLNSDNFKKCIASRQSVTDKALIAYLKANGYSGKTITFAEGTTYGGALEAYTSDPANKEALGEEAVIPQSSFACRN